MFVWGAFSTCEEGNKWLNGGLIQCLREKIFMEVEILSLSDSSFVYLPVFVLLVAFDAHDQNLLSMLIEIFLGKFSLANTFLPILWQ